MKFRYDDEVDALYIELISGEVKESEEVKPGLILDIGQDGNVIGIELLDASKKIGKKLNFVDFQIESEIILNLNWTS